TLLTGSADVTVVVTNCLDQPPVLSATNLGAIAGTGVVLTGSVTNTGCYGTVITWWTNMAGPAGGQIISSNGVIYTYTTNWITTTITNTLQLTASDGVTN